MLNINRFIKPFNQYLLKFSRSISISKSDLIESSRNIQDILRLTDDQSIISKWFYLSLNEIHNEFRSKSVAKSTKDLYEQNASKLNSKYLELENDRKTKSEKFYDNNSQQLIILLRYIRYLHVTFILRLVTYDISESLKQISNSIFQLTRNQKHFQNNALSLTCELTFFINSLLSQHSYSHVKSLLSETQIIDYISRNLISNLNDKSSILIINELCRTLNAIYYIPKFLSHKTLIKTLFDYISSKRCCLVPIIEYLSFIQSHSNESIFLETFRLLNDYLINVGIHQNKLPIICALNILLSSFNYSHELFHREIVKKIRNNLSNSKDKNDIKLYCRLIYGLCLNDPTNRLQTRTLIIELSQELLKLLPKFNRSIQWIVQAQHGMMLLGIYNYDLLYSTVRHQKEIRSSFFEYHFKENLGIYTNSIQRQLHDIHHILNIDRPTIKSELLNSNMLAYAAKMSNEYRSTIRSTQKAYTKLLTELNQILNDVYGRETSQIINTDEKYPYIIFDFLEVNLPDTDHLKSIGINPKQRVAVLPMLNSMLIKQQRQNGRLVRVLSAHTVMRYRIIEKLNYQILLIFHGEFIRAAQNNQFKTLFETRLSLKTDPTYIDNVEL